jgi:hypothetical protein
MNKDLVVSSSSSDLVEEEENEIVNQTLSNQESDIEYARNTYLELIEQNKTSLELMIDLASELESPRMFEVLSQSIKSTADITDRLVALHETNKKLLEKEKPESDKPTTTNNNLILTTAELQKILIDNQK